MMFLRGMTLASGFLLSAACFAQNSVAVVAYGQTPEAEPYLRVAQTRLEQLLGDNGVGVIDQKKAEELKKSWKKLSEPGALITAEEFVENSSKYEIAGVYRIYLGLGKTLGLAAVHVATAATDVRYIGENAQVKSAASSPMGTKGMPPSDGLTEPAAVNNAIQRAVDSAAEKLGLKIMDITNPRLVALTLKKLPSPVAGAMEPYRQPPRLANKDPVAKMAKLIDDKFSLEEPTCVRKSPDSRMAVVGGYIQTATFSFGRPGVQVGRLGGAGGRPPEAPDIRSGEARRDYASVLHVVDLDAAREVVAFRISASDPRYQRGGSRITDCLFMQSWRYVAAVSQSHVAFFDTERGTELGRGYFDEPFDNPSLAHVKNADNDYLVVREGPRAVYYHIVRE